MYASQPTNGQIELVTLSCYEILHKHITDTIIAAGLPSIDAYGQLRSKMEQDSSVTNQQAKENPVGGSKTTV